MKTVRWVLLLSVLVGVPALPQAAAQDRTPPKYWIFFADDADGGRHRTAEPGYLTPRALDRRARRGRPPASSLDAPVPAHYVAALEALGIEPLVESRWFNAVSARLDADRIAALRTLPFVRDIRPVARRRALPAPVLARTPAPLYPSASKTTRLDYGPSEAQLAQINAIEPLENGINGTGVRIGFLDTEFGAFDHPVFQHLHDAERLIATQNFTGQGQSDRHGMAVASVAVGFAEGTLIGPGYGAEVLGATTEYAPTETHQEEDNFVAGLEWLESQGVDVVNVSLGYTNAFDDGNDYTPADLNGDTGITTRAADLAAQMGVVVVASAGNEGCSSPALCWYYIATPADGDSVIAVGGVSTSGNRVSFSGQGPTADGRIKPDVAARGSGVYTAQSGGGYGSQGGTSFSAPLVTGVVAQMLQVNPDLDPMEVRGILRATASQAGAPDNQLGWGIVDAAAAIMEAERCRDAAIACIDVTPTAIAAAPLLPGAATVHPPFPNPFSEQTVLEVTLPSRNAFVELSVYDVLGRRVAVPFTGPLQPGQHRLVLDAKDLPPGLYLYALQGDGIAHTGKLMVVR